MDTTYITKQNWIVIIHKSYYDDGFINLVWDHYKSEFIHCLNNEKYYLIVEDLDSLIQKLEENITFQVII